MSSTAIAYKGAKSPVASPRLQGEADGRNARRVRGSLRELSARRLPLTRIASAMQSDLSPQAGRGGQRPPCFPQRFRGLGPGLRRGDGESPVPVSCYFPVHTGLRFSPNAFRPSFASSVIASNAIWLSV